MQLCCSIGVRTGPPTLLLAQAPLTYGHVEGCEAVVHLQCRRQGPSSIISNAIELAEVSAPTLSLLAGPQDTHAHEEGREAAVPLQCLRNGPSTIIVNAIELKDGCQSPSRLQTAQERTLRLRLARLSFWCSADARA